jgi:hypothetical protein
VHLWRVSEKDKGNPKMKNHHLDILKNKKTFTSRMSKVTKFFNLHRKRALIEQRVAGAMPARNGNLKNPSWNRHVAYDAKLLSLLLPILEP